MNTEGPSSIRWLINKHSQSFWAFVDQAAGSEGCWPWTGPASTSGYGRYKIGGEYYIASRLSWELHNREYLHDRLALHNCDNPICCNPQHIYAGTQTQNMLDAYRRKRRMPIPMAGEANPRSKLTEGDVRAIKDRIAEGETNTAIARDYAVTHHLISRIRVGKSWPHIE